MPLPSLTTAPIWTIAAAFTAAAVVVWAAGWRLSVLADVISRRANVGQAFVGLLLLGAATSLPELATALTLVLLGNAPLAIATIFGAIATPVAFLAVADVASGREAGLTFFTPRPVLMLEGTLLILLLAIAVAAMATGDARVGPVGPWTPLLLAAYLLSVELIRRYEGHERWRPKPPEDPHERAAAARAREALSARQQARERTERPYRRVSNPGLALRVAVAVAAILAAGVALALAGDALARRTTLGSGFVGVVLLGVAVSLPELSTVTSAARLGANSLAISDVFGTSLLKLGSLFVLDLAHRQGTILTHVDRASMVAGALAIALTAVYLAGLIERRDRAVLRMGVDSLVVLILYLGGMLVLYAAT